jgi:hypothetical protein
MRFARRDAEIGNLADLVAPNAVEQLEEPLDPVAAEGKRLLEEIRLATARCLDEIENKMRERRAFIADVYDKLSCDERIEFLKRQKVKHPNIEREMRRWRRINEETIWHAKCLFLSVVP